MIGWNILLCARVESTTFKSAPSLRLRSTGLYFLGSCYPMYRWTIEFSLPLPTLLQLQSCLVLCISPLIIIIPKLPNTRCKQSLSELPSLCTENFLIVILLNPASLCHGLHPTGALGNTFLMLFQLKWFLIYFDQFVQNALYVITPKHWCLVFWRWLLSGFRWVVSEYNRKISSG